MWDFISSVAGWIFLISFVVACIFAISINDNRLDEVRFIEQTLQRNAQKVAGLGRAAIDPQFTASHPEVDQHFRSLVMEAAHYEEKAHGLNYMRIYGSGSARLKRDRRRDKKALGKPDTQARSSSEAKPYVEAKPAETKLVEAEPVEVKQSAQAEQHEEGYKVRIADYFHANSDTMNVMIIGMCACAIAVSAAKLLAATKLDDHTAARMFLSLTIFDIALGALTGLLTTFVVKSGSNALSNTSIGNVDVSNPYGVAFVAAAVGLFTEKFYSWLQPAVTSAKTIGSP
jgi:hypothetical protein